MTKGDPHKNTGAGLSKLSQREMDSWVANGQRWSWRYGHWVLKTVDLTRITLYCKSLEQQIRKLISWLKKEPLPLTLIEMPCSL